MIIENKRYEKEVNFEILKEGDVFSYNNFYYMKVENCHEYGNAVSLQDGEITEFFPDHGVVKLNAKLIIE